LADVVVVDSDVFDRCPLDISHMQNTMPPPHRSAGKKAAIVIVLSLVLHKVVTDH